MKYLIVASLFLGLAQTAFAQDKKPSKAYTDIFYAAAEGKDISAKQTRPACKEFSAYAKDKPDKIAALQEWDKEQCEKVFKGSCDDKPRWNIPRLLVRNALTTHCGFAKEGGK